MATKKKRSCLDCMNLRYQLSVVWCRKKEYGFSLFARTVFLPVKDIPDYRTAAAKCEAFNDADL